MRLSCCDPITLHLLVWAGRDASRAFVSGDFSEGGLTDDVSGLSPVQALALYDWLAFYQKEYPPVGGSGPLHIVIIIVALS